MSVKYLAVQICSTLFFISERRQKSKQILNAPNAAAGHVGAVAHDVADAEEVAGVGVARDADAIASDEQPLWPTSQLLPRRG